MKRIIGKILRIARELVLDEKLKKLKSKQSAKNYIYDYVQDYIKGIFRDEDWKGVKRVFDRINNLGVQLDWWVQNGGYFKDRDTGEIKGKKYKFKISYINLQQKEVEFKGQLICSFCGTVQDPMSAYDISLIIY